MCVYSVETRSVWLKLEFISSAIKACFYAYYRIGLLKNISLLKEMLTQYLILLLYFAVLFAIGYFASKKLKTYLIIMLVGKNWVTGWWPFRLVLQESLHGSSWD